MNFEWQLAKSADFAEFNNWHEFLLDKFGEQNAFTNYLTSPDILIGDLIEAVITPTKKQTQILTRCFTARLNGELVGFVMVTQKENNIDVEVLAVKPTIQAKGIGTAMIFDLVKNREQILGFNAESFTSQIHDSNTPSKKVFERNGFSNIDSKPGVKEAFMQYKLLTTHIDNKEKVDKSVYSPTHFKK